MGPQQRLPSPLQPSCSCSGTPALQHYFVVAAAADFRHAPAALQVKASAMLQGKHLSRCRWLPGLAQLVSLLQSELLLTEVVCWSADLAEQRRPAGHTAPTNSHMSAESSGALLPWLVPLCWAVQASWPQTGTLRSVCATLDSGINLLFSGCNAPGPQWHVCRTLPCL